MAVINAVFPDELHDDAPVTLTAVRELRAAARPFPDVPVVVLSAARGFPRQFRAHWTRLQAGLADAAPQGRHVVVDGTGQNIPRDRPDAVADTILAVAARAGQRRLTRQAEGTQCTLASRHGTVISTV
jgi:pimeloyl-ACP methyl ester carboxylesterase